MQIFATLFDRGAGTINAKEMLTAANADEMFKKVLCFTGNLNEQAIDRVYAEHGFDDSKLSDITDTLTELTDDEDLSIECLNLDGTTHDVADFLHRVVNMMLAESGPCVVEEMSDCQITLLVRIS